MTHLPDQNNSSPAAENADRHCCANASSNSTESFAPSHHIAQPATSASPSKRPNRPYWRSLDDLAQTPEFREFMQREFPGIDASAAAAELFTSNDRRQFLKIMGASMALAGLGMAGCRRWPEEKIAPYAHRPAGHAPGTTDHFATCMDLPCPAAGSAVAGSLLVTSYDYRPIKIEGNPDHPTNMGATDPFMQASVLDLYDPDRSRMILQAGKPSDWQTFTKFAKDQAASLRNSRGNGFAILCESSSSPSVQALKHRLLQSFPQASWHEYEALNNDNIVNGSKLAFGSPHRAHYGFDKARVIVSLESDFLGHENSPQSVKWMRDFVQGRHVDDRQTMSRLYAFESTPSLTGANADHRVAVRSADVAVIAARLAAALIPAAGNLNALTGEKINASIEAGKLDELQQRLIEDLKANQGASIVIAGPRQPAQVHYLVHLINEFLGNIGRTVTYTATPDAIPHVESIKALAEKISSGSVQTLLMIGGNPAYNAPADVNFAELLKKVQTTIHLSDYVDETSKLCTWHINRAHYLETWGDGRAYDGTITLAQPLIEALFDGKSAIELLAVLSGDDVTSGHEIVQRTIREMGSGADFDGFWRKSLHDGFIANSAAPPAAVRVQSSVMADVANALQQQWAAPKGDELEVVFTPDASVYDGRFANNGWLQEMPDPMTKLTWDNAALMAPSTAKRRGFVNGSMINVRANGREMQAAVMIMPGQAAGSIAIALGYGREFAGRICSGAGFNAYKLRSSDVMGFATSANIASAGASYVLATTQDHHATDTVGGQGEQERLPTLFREGTLAEYREHPQFAKHRTHVVHRLSMFEEDMPFQHEGASKTYGYAWAMSIDLNKCTGCNACVIACQAENNIPIVGKDQVVRGREMHWIRVDRYFRGNNEDSPEGIIHAPIPCMQCENAPCEQVCPVAATTHDMDGLNVMVYNRCVGTRYCSNNCPYKVRKFNYFDFHARDPVRQQPGLLLQVQPDYYGKGQAQEDPLKQLQFNPEVTVRMRGIMEKCTYCIQRINKARVEAKNNWVRQRDLDPSKPLDQRVPIPDGTIITACAQACPAQAIVFGDLKDPSSRVSKLHKHERSYEMLEELNTKPRTRYMAKIRNPAFGEAEGGAVGGG